MRKQIMDLAWSLIKANKVSDLSTALRLAWARFKITTALTTGRVAVKFVKDCGEITTRIAVSAGDGGCNPLTVLFSDLTNGGQIRSLRVDRLLAYVTLD